MEYYEGSISRFRNSNSNPVAKRSNVSKGKFVPLWSLTVRIRTTGCSEEQHPTNEPNEDVGSGEEQHP